MNKKLILFLIIILLTGTSCGKPAGPKVKRPQGEEMAVLPPAGTIPEGALVVPTPQPQSQPQTPTSSEALGEKVPETLVYVYKSANLRDPFVPVVGRGEAIEKGEVKGMAREVNLSMLVLKGYVFSQKRKQALFKSVADGGTYVLDKGKLLDDHGRTVPGVAGIVKPDKVVLISKKNAVKEFKLREESE